MGQFSSGIRFGKKYAVKDSPVVIQNNASCPIILILAASIVEVDSKHDNLEEQRSMYMRHKHRNTNLRLDDLAGVRRVHQ